MSKQTVATLSTQIEILSNQMQALAGMQARTQAQIEALTGQLVTLQAQRLEARVAEKAAPMATPAPRPARKAWSQLSDAERAEARKAQEAYAARMREAMAAARAQAMATGKAVKV